MSSVIKPRFLVGLLLLLPGFAEAESGTPSFAPPNFYFVTNASDYRPVLNAKGTEVIFERTLDRVTKLYKGNLATLDVKQFADIPSTRADWCWDRSHGWQLTIGPVAFTGDDGIYCVDTDGTRKLLKNTQGMSYPSWYPYCQNLAVDVSETPQVPGKKQFTAQINAVSGKILVAPLANDLVWAGFPSVNQVNPRLISFAGQFKGETAYYNQELNYTWVTNRSTIPPKVAPMDRKAPAGPGFLQQFQARAGWWQRSASEMVSAGVNRQKHFSDRRCCEKGRRRIVPHCYS